MLLLYSMTKTCRQTAVEHYNIDGIFLSSTFLKFIHFVSVTKVQHISGFPQVPRKGQHGITKVVWKTWNNIYRR